MVKDTLIFWNLGYVEPLIIKKTKAPLKIWIEAKEPIKCPFSFGSRSSPIALKLTER